MNLSENLYGTEKITVDDPDRITETEEPEDSTVDTKAEGIEDPTDATDGGEEESLVYDVDGEEVSLDTIKQWKSGHMMQSDYTKKTTALATDRTAFEVDRSKLDSKLEMLSGIESDIEKLVMGDLDEVDLDDLREYDTAEYLRIKEKKEQRSKAVANLIQKRADTTNAMHAENYTKLHTARAWDDDSKKKADLDAISKFAIRKGVTQAEFERFTHPAIMEAFITAEKYLDLQDKNPTNTKQAKKVSKTVKPSKKQAPRVKSLAERMYGN
jgi:hypothetical protein